MASDIERAAQSSQQAAPAGKLMSLDVGQARIGVAVCDPLQLGARPLTVIQCHSEDEDFATLARLVQQEEIQAIICGLPLNMDGSEGPQAQSVRGWAQRLAQALRQTLDPAPPILFWDERLSSYEAQSLLAAQAQVEENAARIAHLALPKSRRDKRRRRTGQQRKGQKSHIVDDAIAAAVILQSYLDACKAARTGVESLIDYGRVE
ncbi:Holliday junction resolvase RuvX [Caldilinea sp.]|uniref:Putative pre-16S rRNA nuclease n=2 Tax=Caldilineaceae TaxID=475964 RepID=I0I1P2_CALAS|nr:Holliday junction resolvase RuvX [Caldilinea sp.]BAL99179.1 putative Holliday junction resolvase [Caldilinea aerophila DSM 14535 = NBRC 104270]